MSFLFLIVLFAATCIIDAILYGVYCKHLPKETPWWVEYLPGTGFYVWLKYRKH